MSIEHKDITDPNRHEPKGITTALSNTLYVSDGSGSGAWSLLPVQALNGVTSNGVAGQVVSVDGTGQFALKWIAAKGFTWHANIASPTTITFPTTYTKVNVVTTAGGSGVETTEGTNSRITYTGTPTRRVIINANINIGQSSGADRDIRVALYKNGVIIAQSETILTLHTADKYQLSTLAEVDAATSDYFELYIRNDGASGDVIVYGFNLLFTGL